MANGFKLQVIYNEYYVIIQDFIVSDPLTKKIGVGVLIINGTVNVVAIYYFAGNRP